MCVVAGPLALGLGKAAPLFYANLGIQGAQMIQRNRAARQAANYQYEAARRQALSAEQAFAQQQEGLAANLKETRAAQAQERLAARDAGRQQANLRNKINQTMASATGQYRRNALGLLAKRDSRRNQALDLQNQAYATAQQNTSGIFDFLGAGVRTYTGLYNA